MAEKMPRVWCNSSKAESRAPHNESNSKGTSKKQETSKHIIYNTATFNNQRLWGNMSLKSLKTFRFI